MPRTFDRDKCRRRNAHAALKGFNAVPWKLSAKPPGIPEGSTLVSARGTLPKSDAEAVERINATVNPREPLTAEKVHVHYLEAANTNYIADRYMFIHRSTLKNIATQAERGFAFMNSHATGGISHDAQLPFGRTFAGRFETWQRPDGSKFSRAILGVYMLAGQAPNGASGPTTDDLSASIDGGTVFDVSIGLDYGETGYIACDVCGHDAELTDSEGRYICSHVPGTTRRMTAEQVQAQKDRGVPRGMATASFVDCGAREISAVYDGAVPGAGFSKAMKLARGGRLDRTTLAQVLESYADLLEHGGAARRVLNRGRTAADHRNSRGNPPMSRAFSLRRFLGLADALDRAGIDIDDLDEIEDETEGQGRRTRAARRVRNHATLPVSAAADDQERQPDPELAQLRQDLATEREARESDRRAARIERFESQADATVAEEKAADRLTAKQATDLRALLRQAAVDDHEHPVKDFNRVAALKALMAEAKPHGNAQPKVAGGEKPAGAKTLQVHDAGDVEDPAEWAKKANDAHLGKNRRRSG